MKCHYCGGEVRDGSRYCLFCGTRQEPEEPVLWEPEIRKEEPEQTPEFSVIGQMSVQNLYPEPEPKTEPESVPEPEAEPELPAAPEGPARNRIYTRLQLPTKRGLGKMFFLGILTLGIYPTVIWSRIVTELNLAACRYDGKRTMPYFGMMMLTGITMGIYPLVWMHTFCNRIGDELERRKLDYKFSAKTFWLWGVLGSLIIAGPFVFTHKLMQSMNRINGDFNIRA